MIKLQNVTRTFNTDEESAITPVHNVNLSVDRGEFVLLIGRSGSGKTSLLNLVAGLIRPTSGKVFIKDTDISVLTDRQLSTLRAGTLGFVFQFPSLIPALNVLENTVLPISFSLKWRQNTARDHAITLLNKVGLGGRMGALPRQLSAGEQKRVVLARALMNRPEILLADEPTSDLDELTEKDIMVILKELHSAGTTILMVTHSTELIPYSNRALKMEEGNIVDITSSTKHEEP
jgi:putative ABC transport system ATP-binding protein